MAAHASSTPVLLVGASRALGAPLSFARAVKPATCVVVVEFNEIILRAENIEETPSGRINSGFFPKPRSAGPSLSQSEPLVHCLALEGGRWKIAI